MSSAGTAGLGLTATDNGRKSQSINTSLIISQSCRIAINYLLIHWSHQFQKLMKRAVHMCSAVSDFRLFLYFGPNSSERKRLGFLDSNCQSGHFDSNLSLCHRALKSLTYFTTNCWCISCIHLLVCSLVLYLPLCFRLLCSTFLQLSTSSFSSQHLPPTPLPPPPPSLLLLSGQVWTSHPFGCLLFWNAIG